MFWRLRCDFGHERIVLSFPNALPLNSTLVCQHGHQIVTQKAEQPAGLPAITIVPAVRLSMGSAHPQLIGSAKYYLLLFDIKSGQCFFNDTPDSLADALSLTNNILEKMQASSAWTMPDGFYPMGSLIHSPLSLGSRPFSADVAFQA